MRTEGQGDPRTFARAAPSPIPPPAARLHVQPPPLHPRPGQVPWEDGASPGDRKGGPEEVLTVEEVP